MKNILLLSILFCTIAMPAFADLTLQDLEVIRSIIKEEIKEAVDPLKTEIVFIKTDIKSIKSDIITLKTDVAWIKGSQEGVDKQISQSTNLTYGLIALIVVTVGVPQIIMLWRSRGESAQDRRIEELAREIEALKQQRIMNP